MVAKAHHDRQKGVEQPLLWDSFVVQGAPNCALEGIIIDAVAMVNNNLCCFVHPEDTVGCVFLEEATLESREHVSD